MKPQPHRLQNLREDWMSQWPAALASWSKYTRLRVPTLCLTDAEAKKLGLQNSFAMIRLADQTVVVNLQEVERLGLQGFAHQILAHEIGHHVLAPADLRNHGRTIARMRWALPTVEHHAPLISNLYTDLLINDRLQRTAGLDMAAVYRALRGDQEVGSVWAVYMRIYELLWALQRGSLRAGHTTDQQEGDAHLGARLMRSYAHEWIEGSGRFAALLLPYLLKDNASAHVLQTLFDTKDAGQGAEADGLAEAEEGERRGAVHPAEDEDIESADTMDGSAAPKDVLANVPAAGQSRQPFEYGELLRAAGMRLSDEDLAVRYYREKAQPHLVPFPTRLAPASQEPLPEGLEPWEIGDAIDVADWLQTVLISPRVVPGVTTVKRVWGLSEGTEPKRQPMDLDLYVDSSGSMVDPRRLLSFPALAGAIICLSGLRVGARIQATLWSGPQQCAGTDGFVNDRSLILGVLTGYFGGSTAFPLHRLRDTFAKRAPSARPVHIMVISDDGVSSMFADDERGTSGWTIASNALTRAGGGGSMVLNLPAGWDDGKSEDLTSIRTARDQQGWDIHRVTDWPDLVAFARSWSRKTYGGQGDHG